MTANPDLVRLDEIRAAAERIAPFVQETPIIALTPTGILLKAESLHPIGAFKIRGAFNALLTLSDEERRRGVVAHSSGNHAQAVAYAAKKLDVRCVIVMPDNSSRVKLEATKYWGAEVHLVKPAERASTCEQLARELQREKPLGPQPLSGPEAFRPR
jgi:threonine dehydratase